ncbi:MAG: aminotransferase class V-fold PLP-dependent enzyme [Alphaproteobacteria bacterium]|nr:MAG: aminotransferase class V-fold PLP-dependent enzyme [Alphaproteobacteria bacterium]
MINKTFNRALKKTKADGLTYLQGQVIGHGHRLGTPFGAAPLIYADYTASGRGLKCVEKALSDFLCHYANSHTEDDHTGETTTQALHEASNLIRRALGANEDYAVLPCGTGATGAIDRLQNILGIALPPATKSFIENTLESDEARADFWRQLKDTAPVVFVGPYEHHSNEVTWRQGLCTVVTIGLNDEGRIDLAQLAKELDRPEFSGRRKIGAFSAASNVTGLRTDVGAITELLHSKGALACFDYAACAPYLDVNMTVTGPSGAPCQIDAVYFSPHKFLGGPGASGLLVLTKSIYARHLAPSIAGGGTVSFVDQSEHDFLDDIETRENAGTPGITQTLRAAMVLALKEALSNTLIETREHHLLQRAWAEWQSHDHIEVLGDPDPSARVGIVSFNIKDPRGRYLHPKLVTRLLNDLFGIQSRAGCSCAGPYGHHLLKVDADTSLQYREAVGKGLTGLKPGWCRIGLHYILSDEEIQYLINAVTFLADYGYRFAHLYEFDIETGNWAFNAQRQCGPTSRRTLVMGALLPLLPMRMKLKHCMRRAQSLARNLEPHAPKTLKVLDPKLEKLQYFSVN